MKVTPVSRIEIEPWVAACIMRKVNAGLFICICNVKYDEYNFWTKHVLVYNSYFKPLHQLKFFGALFDNRADADIFVLEDKDRETKKNLIYALK